MFVIRNIRSDDRRTIALTEAFLLDNPDPGVRRRPDLAIKEAIEGGQGLVVMDGSDIRGVSFVYKFQLGGGELLFSEIGTMRIIANGYDLQIFLAWLHLVQIRLEDGFEDDCNVFAVVSPNTASEHNLERKLGMGPWTPTEALAAARSAAGVPFTADKRILLAGEPTIATAFAGLRKAHQEGVAFQTPKRAHPVQIEMGWFDPAILDLNPGA